MQYEIRFYLCTDLRYEYAEEIAEQVEYTTLVEAEGLSREYGREDTLIVSHFFDDNRKWQWHADLKPYLLEYLSRSGEDTLGIWLDRGHVREFHLLAQDDVNTWLRFENHLIG